jgi:hypothetical protein
MPGTPLARGGGGEVGGGDGAGPAQPHGWGLVATRAALMLMNVDTRVIKKRPAKI